MKNLASIACGVLISLVAAPLPAECQTMVAKKNDAGKSMMLAKDADANTLDEPKQILRTGIDLCETGWAANSHQLAETIGVMPILDEIEKLRAQIAGMPDASSIERIAARQDLNDRILKASLIVQRTSLDVDFTIAEIAAEQEIYAEMLATYLDARDKALAKTNALSFISNGALWAVCEGLAIPTYKQPRYAIPSGITGVLAGIIPSAASMYAMKQVSGKKKASEADPNMLAKFFGYPTTADIDYPDSVWQFLNQVPAGDKKQKSRREQLIDSWIEDSNIVAFTDRKSKRQLDIMTASAAQKKGLSIDTLTARKVMLQRLAAEILKMKRPLLEIAMVIQGDKSTTAYVGKDKQHISTKNSSTN